MDTVLNGKKIRIDSDTHFGKEYTTGVPLNRRGERERMTLEAFERGLTGNYDLYIHCGDLFDKPVVDLDVLMVVYRVISDFAKQNSDRFFYFIKGNHDQSRNAERVDCFRILSSLLSNVKNVVFVQDESIMLRSISSVLCPWVYGKTPEELCDGTSGCDNLFGHFEEPVDAFVASWAQSKGSVFSGHIHKKHVANGVEFVGATLPTNHGDADDDSLYVTVDLNTLLANPEDYTNKCVRVELDKGDVLPTDINCLALTSRYKMDENEVVDLNEVKMDDFNLESLFKECVKDSGMGDMLWERYNSLRVLEG